MENQMIDTKRQNSGRYLQSLDSVRFAESDSNALVVQARVELLTSLLFGQTIPIAEHQFLDSNGFIPNAVKLIESLKLIDDPRDRSIVESIFPFRVGIRSELMPIDNFIALKLGDTNYQLSKWEKLNKKPEIRLKIKKMHEENRFKFNNLYTLLPDQEIEINELKMVRDRFLYGEKDGAFQTFYGTPTIMIAEKVPLLQFGFEEITKLDESLLYNEIEQQQEMVNQGIEPSAYIEPELFFPCIELITLIKELKKANLQFNNRTSIRKDTHISRAIVPDEKKFGAILEIFDRLYNSAAAEAVQSYSEEVSSARDFDDIYIQAGTSLAELAISKIPLANNIAVGKTEQEVDLHWEIDTDFNVLHNSKVKIAMSNIPWEVVWYAYLDEGWKKSLNELNLRFDEVDNLLNHPTDDVDLLISARNHLDDAVSAHIENISRLLKGSIIKMNKDLKTGETFVSVSTDTVSVASTVAATFIVSSMGITFPISGFIVAAAGLIPKLAGHKIKPYLPNIASWNTTGEIRRVLKKIFNQN
ncbi:hypothetical protein KKF04_00205 [Patescibacteria group bacterium]|nr:hypothetical protein [Patescibacteria group bacterium]